MVDVARLAGVSLKTVSRVVNGEPNVSGGTADRVHDAITRLDFRRNYNGLLLRRGRTGTVGLVIDDVGDPFFAVLMAAVEQVAHRHDTLVLAASSEGRGDREKELVEVLASRRVDGLLVVPSRPDQRYLLPEMAAGTPVVFVDRPPAGVEADVVLSDNEGGASAGVRHLAGRGYRRIAFVGDAVPYSCRSRLRGFRAGLDAAGLPRDDRLVRTGVADTEAARAVVRTMLASGTPSPEAVFTSNNRMTVGALHGLRDSGAAGRQVEVVGFDDLELADLVDPPVTVVAQDPVELGRAAAELLLARMRGDTGLPRRQVVPTRLVVRGSRSARV